MSTVTATGRRPPAPARRAPGPGGNPWLQLGRYLHHPLATMERLRAEYGPVAYVPFPGGHSFFFVTDPVLIRRVLVDDQALFVKGRALQAARRLLGDGLLTSEGVESSRPPAADPADLPLDPDRSLRRGHGRRRRDDAARAGDTAARWT